MNDFGSKTGKMVENVRRGILSKENVEKERDYGFQSAMRGNQHRLYGITPDLGNTVAKGDEEGGTTKMDIRSPKPYGFEIVDGKEVPRWLLPSGEVTTDILQADQSEHSALQGRIQRGKERYAEWLNSDEGIEYRIGELEKRKSEAEAELKRLTAERDKKRRRRLA